MDDRREVERRVWEITGNRPGGEVTCETKISHLAEIDSLDIAEIELAVEDAFGVVMPEIGHLTIAELVEEVWRQS